MALAIGQATGKWFGSPAIEKDVAGFTAITSAPNVVIVTGTATVITDTITGMIAVTTAITIVATNNQARPQILRDAGPRAGVLFSGEKQFAKEGPFRFNDLTALLAKAFGV